MAGTRVPASTQLPAPAARLPPSRPPAPSPPAGRTVRCEERARHPRPRQQPPVHGRRIRVRRVPVAGESGHFFIDILRVGPESMESV